MKCIDTLAESGELILARADGRLWGLQALPSPLVPVTGGAAWLPLKWHDEGASLEVACTRCENDAAAPQPHDEGPRGAQDQLVLWSFVRVDEAIVLDTELSTLGSLPTRVQGGPGDRAITARGSISLTPSQAGLDPVDDRLVQRVAVGGHVLVTDDHRVVALLSRHWQPSAVEHVRAAQGPRQTQPAWPARTDAMVERERRLAADGFVNPYNFVGIPGAECERARPTGHLAPGADCLTARLRVTWTVQTPLALPAEAALFEAGGPLVPGSSVKGAVRSVHEALSGGCVRVLDEDFLPVFRQAAVAPVGDWRLGVVQADCQLLLTERPVWVPDLDLVNALARPIQSGERVDLTYQGPVNDRHGRRSAGLPLTARASPTGDHVLLLSHSQPRETRTHGYVAAGRLTDDVVSAEREVWQAYLAEVHGADDAVKQRRGDRLVLQVRRQGQRLGTRQPAREQPQTGDVLWVQLDARQRPVRLSHAIIWRRRGSTPLGERVPASWHACRSWTALCPSCSLLGAAGATASDQDESAYAGHVAWGGLRSEGPVAITAATLAPLSSPRPGAGQFYLQNGEVTPKNGVDETTPLRQWGSRIDHPHPRQVRGRKFYWAGDPERQREAHGWQRPRWEGTGDAAAMVRSARLVVAGSVLTQEITVDNVTRAQLGGLLAALCPDLLTEAGAPGWAARPAGRITRLGGGKPLGLGVARTTVEIVNLTGAGERYSSPGSQRNDTLQDLVEAFVASVPPVGKATWPDLAALLDPEHLPVPEALGYPPLSWETQETSRATNFSFWQKSWGSAARRQGIVYELLSLPPAASPWQLLPLAGEPVA